MKILRMAAMVACAFLSGAALTACEKDGGMEEVGEDLDEAGEDIEEGLEDAGD
jgi:hypothetical protein